LSDGHFYRVGGHTAVKTNVRVIAATHQNLEQRVKEGAFREDLFHRLNVIRLRLPALRERRDDIPMLTRHFLTQSAQQLGIEPKRISDAALAWLSAFSFPGNVRQLENICHWLTVMAPAQMIEPKDLPPEVGVSHDTQPERRALFAEPSALTSLTEHAMLAPPRVEASGHPRDVDELNRLASGVPPTSHNPLSEHAIDIEASTLAGLGKGSGWELGLEAEAMTLLANGRHDVWDALTRRFESRLILTALSNTRGRRIEAANKLGIGRNTITRKIQELGLEG
jgi:two-component system, NtrC family, nitrogen regulation response regulator GlnG